VIENPDAFEISVIPLKLGTSLYPVALEGPLNLTVSPVDRP